VDPYFYAFDLVYADGKDIRSEPLVRRKARLRKIVPLAYSPVLYLCHVRGKGVELFREVCRLDMEGIVGKLAMSPYDGSGERSDEWVKITNRQYSQMKHRFEHLELTAKANRSPL
jgi:bifunctional non-homologous end joining protein LigD